MSPKEESIALPRGGNPEKGCLAIHWQNTEPGLPQGVSASCREVTFSALSHTLSSVCRQGGITVIPQAQTAARRGREIVIMYGVWRSKHQGESYTESPLGGR